MIGKRQTKAEILCFAIAYCLRRVRLATGRRYIKPELTEAQRYEVAEKVVDSLRRQGWKELDEEIEIKVGLTGPSRGSRDVGG